LVPRADPACPAAGRLKRPAGARGELRFVTPAPRPGEPTALVIVLEDLRWTDGDTGELVKYLADTVSGLPVLLGLTLGDSPASTALEAARRQRNPVCNHLISR